MTPPCPNCGTVYSLGPVDQQGWRKISIASTVIFEDTRDGSKPFWGEEFFCNKCHHRWKVQRQTPRF